MSDAERVALLESCERAVPVVLEIWPDWEPAVVIERAAEPLPDGIAARVDGLARAGEPTTGDRLLVTPGLTEQLSSEGLDVVLRHELTHLATRSTTTAPAPLWAIEGLAELVAYTPVADDRRDRGADVERLRAAVAAGTWSGTVPEPADFDAASEVSLAYTAAWLAVSALVHSEGRDAVVQAMRPGADPGAPARGTAGLDDADRESVFLASLGVTRTELDTLWTTALQGG